MEKERERGGGKRVLVLILNRLVEHCPRGHGTKAMAEVMVRFGAA